MVTGDQIEQEARRWLGTPFCHHGRKLQIGVDCIGLVVGVRDALGLVPDYEDDLNYAADPDGRMARIMDRYLVRMPAAARGAGLIVHVTWSRLPQHAGILTRHGTLIHAYGRRGVVESSFTGPILRVPPRIYRFPEMEFQWHN